MWSRWLPPLPIRFTCRHLLMSFLAKTYWFTQCWNVLNTHPLIFIILRYSVYWTSRRLHGRKRIFGQTYAHLLYCYSNKRYIDLLFLNWIFSNIFHLLTCDNWNKKIKEICLILEKLYVVSLTSPTVDKVDVRIWRGRRTITMATRDAIKLFRWMGQCRQLMCWWDLLLRYTIWTNQRRREKLSTNQEMSVLLSTNQVEVFRFCAE